MVGDGYFLILGSRGSRGEIFLGEVLGMPKDKKCCHFYGVKHAKTSRSSKNFKMHACADQQRPAAMLCLRKFGQPNIAFAAQPLSMTMMQ